MEINFILRRIRKYVMDDSQHETIGGKSVRVAYPAESGNDDIFWSYSLSSWTNW